MGAPDLILQLRQAGYSISADGNYLDISPADNLSPDLLQQLKQHKPEILAALRLEQQREARREKVLAMLAADPDMKRAIYVDTDNDPENAILAIAIRHAATFEMQLPRANFDPWQLLALIDKTGVDEVH
jgi:TubC N-terminal docking domain